MDGPDKRCAPDGLLNVANDLVAVLQVLTLLIEAQIVQSKLDGLKDYRLVVRNNYDTLDLRLPWDHQTVLNFFGDTV